VEIEGSACVLVSSGKTSESEQNKNRESVLRATRSQSIPEMISGGVLLYSAACDGITPNNQFEASAAPQYCRSLVLWHRRNFTLLYDCIYA
jgi:hypothetical protein